MKHKRKIGDILFEHKFTRDDIRDHIITVFDTFMGHEVRIDLNDKQFDLMLKWLKVQRERR